MATNYPTSLDNGTSLPYPSSTDDTNSPSLAGGQDNQNDALIAVETKLGTGSSTPSGTYALVSTGTGTSAWSLATPTSTIVGISDTQTLTNKTIDAANNTITSLSGSDLADNTVTATQIANQTITATQIANATITGTQIANATITGNNLVGINLWGVMTGGQGTPPAAKTGQFYIQGGESTQTLNSGGGGTITYPNAFPNNTLAPIICLGDNGLLGDIAVINSQVSATGFGFQVSGAASDTIRVSWIAIGF